jgi:SAM-dependent methyltransferase
VAIQEFEQSILAQRAVPPDHYDQVYFHTNWRAGANNYSVAARRGIEARNPALIKDVFDPKRGLDCGCGPGALLYFLWELGVHADGVDFSEYARESAPPEIRGRIFIGRLDEPLPVTEKYDLVICREVLEHLTVRQIQQAVQNMCAAASRYIYVTTRFSARSEDLLAVDTEPEVDPSHISLLNKDFLRCLFVLQGFRSRPDLEARMDWRNYGRVLVLERVP